MPGHMFIIGSCLHQKLFKHPSIPMYIFFQYMLLASLRPRYTIPSCKFISKCKISSRVGGRKILYGGHPSSIIFFSNCCCFSNCITANDQSCHMHTCRWMYFFQIVVIIFCCIEILLLLTIATICFTLVSSTLSVG